MDGKRAVLLNRRELETGDTTLIDELLHCLDDGSLSHNGAIEWLEKHRNAVMELRELNVPGTVAVLRHLDEALEQLPKLFDEVRIKLNYCSECNQELTYDELRISKAAGLEKKPLCKVCFRRVR